MLAPHSVPSGGLSVHLLVATEAFLNPVARPVARER